jgi:fatty acid desaturase
VSFLILILGVALAPSGLSSTLSLAVVLIALGSIQVALVGHDAGHEAVFTSHRANARLGRLCWSFVLGISFWYWNDRHTRHHAHPNELASDPDVQWDHGLALLPLLAFTFRIEGWRFVLRQPRGLQRNVELLLLGIGTSAWLLPTIAHGWSWLITVFAAQVLAGLYLALVVAPNHIGMPTWPSSSSLTFLDQQVRSSRNVAPGPLCDFLFGGLNYQIEHHLFPMMPRNHFATARELVRPFCEERGLPYAELGVLEVFRLVWHEAPRVGRRARI